MVVTSTLRAWFSSALIALSCPSAIAAGQTTAFFYGSPVPVTALSRYDRVVVEAENLPQPGALAASGTVVFAYVSVGEAEGWRASTKELDDKLFIGKNAPWESRIADLTHPEWANFLIEKRSDSRRTMTSVTELKDDDRVAEIARMMGGSAAGEKALASARELLETSGPKKAQPARTDAGAKAKGERRKSAKEAQKTRR